MKKLILIFFILIPGLVSAYDLDYYKDKSGGLLLQAKTGIGQYYMNPEHNWNSFLEYDESFAPLFYVDLKAGYRFIPVVELRLESSGDTDSGRPWFEKGKEENLNVRSNSFSISPGIIPSLLDVESDFLKALFYIKYRETRETVSGSLKTEKNFTYLDKNRNRTDFFPGDHAVFKNRYSLKEYLIMSSPDIRDLRITFGYYELKTERASGIDEWYDLSYSAVGKIEYESKGLMLEAETGEVRTGLYSRIFLRYGFNNDINTPFGEYEDIIDDKKFTEFLNYGGEIGFKYNFKGFKRCDFFLDINLSFSRTDWGVAESDRSSYENEDEDEVLEDDRVYKGFLGLGVSFF